MRSEITPHRKELILKLADGNSEAVKFIWMLERATRREDIYRWLINNRITGKNLVTFFEERRFSLLQVVKDVLKVIEKSDRRDVFGSDIV